MNEPRITSIRLYSVTERKKPKSGDLRWLKGRRVWQIRQQEMVTLPGSGGRRAALVSNGRPVWEWVDRGSERDREWQWSARQGSQSDTDLRAYFEAGCLCLIEGRMAINPCESNKAAAARYLADCTCSRHPESGSR